MASPTIMRLPWRLLNRSCIANPVVPATHLFGAQHATNPLAPGIACRYASDVISPPASRATSAPPPEELDTIVQQTPLERDLAKIGPNKSIDPPPDFRLPRSVQAVYLKPLRREAPYGVPVCDLQLRSYSVRNLEFFSDFCLRAAYYLGLPAFGPIPLPRITERWTVPRSSFIYKKSQENFERRTVRRLIQIKDGNPETVQIWLAFLKKHAYYGIGMKANVWEFSKLSVAKQMDAEMEKMKESANMTLDQVAIDQSRKMTPEQIIELVNTENFRSATHGNAPYSKTPIPLQTI